MATKILIIDHNDSFTYNLVGLFEAARDECDERLVDRVSVWKVGELPENALETLASFDALVLSPGPGLPKDYPVVFRLLKHVLQTAHPMPVLGICLGLQEIITYFGGTLYNLTGIQHGRQVDMMIDTSTTVQSIFEGLESTVKVGLYHSWAMDKAVAVPGLQVLAVASVHVPESGGGSGAAAPAATDGGADVQATELVMALSHKDLPVCGLQFHPESYMTPDGARMVRNWLYMLDACKR